MAKARHTSLRLLHIRPYSRYAITRPPVSVSKNDPIVQQALDLLGDDVDVTIVEDSLDGPTVPRNIVLHAQRPPALLSAPKDATPSPFASGPPCTRSCIMPRGQRLSSADEACSRLR
ncbi:hypothetical protein ACX80T_03145 [Arthrobacter sp. Sr33]